MLRIAARAVSSAFASLIVLGLEATGPAAAQPQSDYACRSFTAPNVGSGMPMVTTKDGVVWFVDKNANRLIRVEKDHSFTAVVPVDGATSQLTGLALAPDGAIWYSKNTSHRMGRIPANGGKGVEYELPAPNVFTGAIAAASDGRIWYVDPVVNKVGYMTGDGNVVTYDAPRFGGVPLSPAGIAVAADGSVWVTSVGLNAVFRVDPGTGAFTRYDIATPNAQPDFITPGPKGDLWFIMRAITKIGRITTSGQITEFAAEVVGLETLAAGPDGAMWFSSAQDVGRLDASSARVDTFACAGGGGMTIGPDRRLWVLGSGNGQINEVRRRSEGTAARVAATADAREARNEAGSSRGAPIETISPDQVDAIVAATSGRVVVQYSSDDPNCGYCVLGNRHYAALVATGEPQVKYLRVLYEPWTSVKQSAQAAHMHLLGLPTIVAFDKGKETSRFEGDAAPEVMKSKLRF
jgi:virginiamycin B lyase